MDTLTVCCNSRVQFIFKTITEMSVSCHVDDYNYQVTTMLLPKLPRTRPVKGKQQQNNSDGSINATETTKKHNTKKRNRRRRRRRRRKKARKPPQQRQHPPTHRDIRKCRNGSPCVKSDVGRDDLSASNASSSRDS